MKCVLTFLVRFTSPAASHGACALRGRPGVGLHSDRLRESANRVSSPVKIDQNGHGTHHLTSNTWGFHLPKYAKMVPKKEISVNLTSQNGDFTRLSWLFSWGNDEEPCDFWDYLPTKPSFHIIFTRIPQRNP